MDLLDYIQAEDSPELTDSEIESAIHSTTEQEFSQQVVALNKCRCGGWRHIQGAKQLLRKPLRYGRLHLACVECGKVEQFTFRMDWLTE